MNFLNAVLQPASPITSLVLLNPLNEREFADDKLTIIDVKAKDASGCTYQVEVQLLVTPALAARMLQNWATLYASQLKRGDDFDALCPVVSVWIVDGKLLPGNLPHSRFEVVDTRQNTKLNDHLAIHVLELAKWKRSLAPEDDWIEFLVGAHDWVELPPALSGKTELEDAMTILNDISDGTADYELYQRRLARQRLDLTIQNRIEKAARQLEVAEKTIIEEQRLRAEAERASVEEHRLRTDAEAEVARLRALLATRETRT